MPRDRTRISTRIGSGASTAMAAVAAVALFPLIASWTASEAADLRAQGTTGGVAVNTQVQIESLASGVTRIWLDGEMGRMEEMLHPAGVEFHSRGVGQVALEPRRAVAALENLVERRRTVDVRVERSRPVAGSTDRGSAELAWQSVAPGTSEVLQQTIFLGFLFEDARWWITEIRILP